VILKNRVFSFFYTLTYLALCLVSGLWASCTKEPAVLNPTTIPVLDTLVPISPHLRGAWLTNVDSKVLYSREGIQRAVKVCRANGINHLFVVMWNKGRTLYPSRIMRDTFGIEIEEGLAGRDPLREILDAAHADSLKVYAWMEYGFAAENSGKGEHILRLRPQWVALNENGQRVVKNGFTWMNALDPQVQHFMLALMKELVIQYPDLDGIQGDDRLPALPSEGGYNPEIIASYKAENGGQEPGGGKTDQRWIDWRANRLSQYAGRIYRELKALNPRLKIAMAPSVFPFAKTEYLQDWPTWVKEGWTDLISPQIYRYNIQAYSQELTKIVSEQVAPEKWPTVYPGVLLKLGSYRPSESFLSLMVQENRLQKINGEIFFFYEGIQENPDYFRKYRSN